MSPHQFASSAAIYGRIGQLRGHSNSRERPQSVYEKQFGPVQHSLLSSPPLTQPRSQQVSIAKATVVNLVKQSPQKPNVESNSSAVTQQPPPLPPRPSGGGLNTSFNPPSVEKPKPHMMKHSSASLPRNTHQRKLKKLQEASSPGSVIKRQSFHDGNTSSALSIFSKPILKSLEDSVEDKPEPKVRKLVNWKWKWYSHLSNCLFCSVFAGTKL